MKATAAAAISKERVQIEAQKQFNEYLPNVLKKVQEAANDGSVHVVVEIPNQRARKMVRTELEEMGYRTFVTWGEYSRDCEFDVRWDRPWFTFETGCLGFCFALLSVAVLCVWRLFIH